MTLTGDDDGDGEVEDSFHAAVLFVSSIGAAVLDRRDGKESKAANEIQTKRDKRRTRLILVDEAWTACEISRYLSCFILGLSKPCESYGVIPPPSPLCSEDHKLLWKAIASMRKRRRGRVVRGYF